MIIDIVNHINSRVREMFTDTPGFSNLKTSGIAVTNSRMVNEVRVSYPVSNSIMNLDEGKMISPDDSVPLEIFHRSGNFSITPQNLSDYGRMKISNAITTFSMSMIAINNQKLTHRTSEEIMQYLLSAISFRGKAGILESIESRATGGTINSQEVSSREWVNVDLGISSLISFLRINYSIITLHDLNCVSICK